MGRREGKTKEKNKKKTRKEGLSDFELFDDIYDISFIRKTKLNDMFY